MAKAKTPKAPKAPKTVVITPADVTPELTGKSAGPVILDDLIGPKVEVDVLNTPVPLGGVLQPAAVAYDEALAINSRLNRYLYAWQRIRAEKRKKR
jgi:hypothetical protein